MLKECNFEHYRVKIEYFQNRLFNIHNYMKYLTLVVIIITLI